MKIFCLYACSENLYPQRDALRFVELINNISAKLGVTLTNLSYFSLESKNADDDIKEIDLTSSRKDETMSLLAQSSFDELFLSAIPNKNTMESYWDFYAGITTDKLVGSCNSVYIEFPMEHISRLSSGEVFTFAADLLGRLNDIAQLDYALITVMDDGKLPSAYFRGIYNPDLNYAEVLNLATWQQQISEHKTRLRGLYWGNLMGASHVEHLAEREDFITKLKHLVGEDFVGTIASNSLFFLLPSSLTESDAVATSVEKLLKTYDLLMQPGESAKELAERMR